METEIKRATSLKMAFAKRLSESAMQPQKDFQ